MRRKLYSYNSDCACANGFPVLAEGRDVIIIRICATEVNMSFWVEELLLDGRLGLEVRVAQ